MQHNHLKVSFKLQNPTAFPSSYIGMHCTDCEILGKHRSLKIEIWPTANVDIVIFVYSTSVMQWLTLFQKNQ